MNTICFSTQTKLLTNFLFEHLLNHFNKIRIEINDLLCFNYCFYFS